MKRYTHLNLKLKSSAVTVARIIRKLRLIGFKITNRPIANLKKFIKNFQKSPIYHWLDPRNYTGTRRLLQQALLLAMTGLLLFSAISPLIDLYVTHRYYSLNSSTSGLVGSVTDTLAKQITYDSTRAAYVFNASGMTPTTQTVGPDKVPLSLLQAKVAGNNSKSKSTYSVVMPTDPKAGISYYDSNTGLSFQLVPNFTEMGAQQIDNHIVYPTSGNTQMVYSVKHNGLKEDIVLKQYVSDSLSFSYSLKLPGTLEARLLTDGSGSLGIYSADPSLFSAATTGPEADPAKTESAQLHAKKDHLVFAIPAPMIKQTGESGQGNATADFSLSDDGLTLTVSANHLKGLHYPISIDPTVVVTSTSDFSTGNNEDNNITYPANQINRGSLTGGSISGGWTATTGLPTSVQAATSVAYNGYAYEIGGFNGTTGVASVYYAAINSSNGTIGSWTATTSLPYTNYQAAAVVYNGYLYEIGGYNGTVALANVYYAPINTNGTIGSWTATTSLPTATRNVTAVVYNGYVYELGGYNNASFVNTVDYASINANGTLGSWTATTVMPDTIGWATSVVYNGYIYELGGTNGSVYLTTVYFAPINANGTVGTWATTTSLSTTTYLSTSAVYNGYLYEIGGSNGTTALNTVSYASINANGTVGAWNSTSALPIVNYQATVLAYNGYIYELGGYNSQTFSYTGSVQSYTVPAGITSITFTADGAGGGSTNASAGPGKGAEVTATVTVTPGDTIYFNVGGSGTVGGYNASSPTPTVAGGYNGGGSGAGGVAGAVGGGGGGGATDVRTGGSALANRIIVAGGGGGAGGGTIAGGGGNGANPNGVNGGIGNALTAATGGTQASGGTGGTADATNGTNGALGTGGNGGLGGNGGGGGAGGGYYGGGGGAGRSDFAGGGGAGGSSYTGAGVTGVTHTQGVQAGNGFVKITNNGSSVNYAKIDPAGVTTAYSSTTVLPVATAYADSVAYNGYVYEIGGTTGSLTANVYYAPINSNGTIGAWTATTALPIATYTATTVAYNGYIYEMGGWNTNGFTAIAYYAPINSNGTIGSWTATTSLPTATASSTSVVYNGYLYEIGGYVGGGTYIVPVYYAPINTNGTLGSWTATTSLPANTAYATSVVYNGYVYEIGGFNGTTHFATVYYAPINTNGTLGSWTATTPLLAATREATSVVYNGYLYEIGGQNVSNYSTVDYAPINSNGTIGAWTAITSIPTATTDATSVVYNGYLYEIGGYNPSVTNTVYYAAINNGGSGTVGAWTSTTSLPAATQSANSVAYNGYLYEIGGWASSAYVATVEYAPINANGTIGAWTATTSLPAAMAIATSVAYNGYIYEVGGYTTTYVNTVYYAPINANGTIGAWIATTALPTTTGYSTSEAYNGYLYEIGGYNGSSTVATVYYAPINANGTIGSWTTTTALPAAIYNSTSVSYNGYLYEIGGYTSTYIATVYFAPINTNGTIGAWATTTVLPFAIASATSVAYNGYLYEIGGSTGSSFATVNYAPINTNGTLGAWSATTSLPTATQASSSIVYNGYLYEIGGFTGSSVSTVSYSSLNVMPRVGRYSQLFSFNSAITPVSITYNGSLPNAYGLSPIQYRTAGSNGVFGSNQLSTVINGSATSCTPGSAQYVEVILTLDDSNSASFPDVNATSANVTDFTLTYSTAHALPNLRLRGGKFFLNNTLQPLDTCSFLVPNAPTIGTATGGNKSATITYTDNAAGDSPITSHLVTANPGGLTGTGSSPVRVSGLTNGVNYTFTVTATSASGTSVPSAVSNVVTPFISWGSWTTTTLLATRNFPFIGYGNGLFLAPQYFVPGTPAGNYGEANIWSSSNGIAWTQRTLPSVQQWRMPIYASGIWVLPTDGANYATSTDGITWTARTMPSGNYWAVTSDGTTFVLVGYGTNSAVTSTDGINWTPRTMATNTAWSFAIYGAGLFVAFSSSSTNTYNTSPDGINWTARTMPSTGLWYNAGWNGTVFLSCSVGTTSAATSTDGINWTPRTVPTACGESMIYSPTGGQFVLTIIGTSTAYTSPDGINWTAKNLPSEVFNSYRASLASGTTYVMGSSTGTISTLVSN